MQKRGAVPLEQGSDDQSGFNTCYGSDELYESNSSHEAANIQGSELSGVLHAETIIVGGGVIGCAIAFELTRRGHDVLLIEQNEIASGSSCAAAGMLAADSEHFAHPVIAQAALESRALLHKQKDQLTALSGMELGLRQSGFITPFRSYNEVSHYKEKRAAVPLTEQVWWDRSTVQREAAWLNRDTYGAYYRSLESEILPVSLTKAYVRSAHRMGARIWEGVKDIQLLVNQYGVQGIVTERGHVTCKHVIIAAGLHSEVLLQQAGISLPSSPVKGEIVAIQFPAEQTAYKPDRTLYAEDIYIVPKANGEVWIGATSWPGKKDHSVSAYSVQRLLSTASTWAPGVKEAHFLRAWAGVRPGTPDGLPYIGECDNMPGLYTAYGHYRNGILLSAVTGRWLADMLEGKSAEEMGIEALSPNRLNRKGVAR
ncbi:glycine oxidase ThiO [Paenibacillus barcinonensis]|uniref:glycine oxidase n=1 Tax=Paenibacillus barcinonensis TaxID=198119 RepID=A0A2V4VJC4_PAEBA|nr:glycine oxidase ThiO [Paenibacillus barcinonensis]PYE49234.1 glycine oxidase [Paenibacillus barcinonensis]QKS55465.1 glycine oxidase ThiO [Paenibacillus barcinonensis]